MTYRIEYYLGRLPMDVDPNDLDWHRMTFPGGVDAEDLEQCIEAANGLDADTEGRITHRVVQVEPEPIDQWDARGLRFVKVESYRRVKVAS
jgi:hypothetical protein